MNDVRPTRTYYWKRTLTSNLFYFGSIPKKNLSRSKGIDTRSAALPDIQDVSQTTKNTEAIFNIYS